MDLTEIRKSIDLIDYEILKLLNHRMELTLKTRKFKEAIADPKREIEVLSNIRNHSRGLIEPDFTEKIYKEIIIKSKELQKKNLKLIGFQGEHGAYGEGGAHKFSSSFVSVPCKEFYDVFHGVNSGYLDYGIVPVENSLEGAVNQVNDLLIETSLHIIGEVNIPVHHCLLALPDTDYREIKVVYSHPQALAQCRGFITRNKLEAKPFYDTAGAAMMLSKDRPKASAAIASILCTDLYNLEVLKENIEDSKNNTTRFLILGKEKGKEEGNKCSIIFTIPHETGSLVKILNIFSEKKINLTRLESRPIRTEPGKYTFLLDFQGSSADNSVKELLKELKEITIMFKFLGCYKEDQTEGHRVNNLNDVNNNGGLL